jgi:ketosteroid isomerase-like protein
MATPPTAPSRPAPVLLEREAELGQATAAIGRACAGIGEVVVLEGPAGIGKTELVRAFRGIALDAGMEALVARGDVAAVRHGVRFANPRAKLDIGFA